MPLILRRHPFFATETTARMANVEVVVRAYQIVVWVSVASKKVMRLDPETPRFLAVVDTGNNHNFSLKEEQLIRWSGLEVESLTRRGEISVGSQCIPLLAANVWLHRNLPGERDHFSKGPPFCLELTEGLAVYPTSWPNPARIPTLGLRALVRAGLKLTLDGAKQHINLRT